MKKLSFSVFALLVCLLFINTQLQFAAVSSKVKNSVKKKSLRTNFKKQSALWQEVSDESLKNENLSAVSAEKYLVFRLNKMVLTGVLDNVPAEFSKALPAKSVIMELPMPDGTLERFRIEESSVLDREMAARYPELKSYRGQGVDNASLAMRFDWTPQGFHAMILTAGQTINIEPANLEDKSLYITYYGDDSKKGEYSCLVKDFQNLQQGVPEMDAPQIAIGPTLRTFRIAIAATFQYTQAYGNNTVSGTISSFNTWVNGANLIYERELSIHLTLVDSTKVIYSADRGYTSATDPYNNTTNPIDMLYAVPNDLETNIGTANYDIGHGMGYLPGGASGVAGVGLACNGGNKGFAATLMGGSVGNPDTLGVWVHELGHEFGADHNFNGTQGYCGGGNRSIESSYESGSGSTIMGYPGICGSDNILNYRDMRFHAMSYAAINNYLNSYGSCSIKTATSNLPPTISGGGNWTIPKNTPFTLTATASDPNGDSLTYNWEQIDAGASYPQNGTSASYNDAGDPSTTTRPIFRPYQSVSSPARDFPNLFYILNFANDPPDTDSYGQQTADELPRIARTLNFRVTARDNRAGGGGVNEDTVRVTVDNSGPFLVTSPNTNVNLSGGTAQTVTWSVNNTNIAPVNAANVKISLSTDGGLTFPTVLAANTPNDGSQSVNIPNITTTTARIKVEAVSSIFFDISNTNFSISAGTGGGAQGLEGDVSTRFTGDGNVNSNDLIILRQLVARIITPNDQYNEFQRADTAPFESSGDGQLNSADIIQLRRYAAFLDQSKPAGGPTQPSTSPALNQVNLFKNGVEKPAVNTIISVGSQQTSTATVTVPIIVNASNNEAGFGFSIDFGTTLLSNPRVVLGNNVPSNTNLTINSNEVAQGRIGILIDSGNVFSGTIQLVNITFDVAHTPQTAVVPISFVGTPIPLNTSNNLGLTVLTTYNGGSVTVLGPLAASVSIGGRLNNGKGRGVANAQILMTNSQGETRAARSNAFGYFRFADVPAGETYIFTVKSKQYRFSAQVVNVTQDLTDLILTAQSSQ